MKATANVSSLPLSFLSFRSLSLSPSDPLEHFVGRASTPGTPFESDGLKRIN